jgi:hypothetical protein
VPNIALVYLVQSPAGHRVRPWHHFKVNGVMVSAYEFMTSRGKREAAVAKGWASILEFDGPVMLDSGGFQYLKGREIGYSPEELAAFARDSEAEYVFSLDYPPRDYQRDFERLSRKNFRNYLRMRKISETIPVVHAPPSLALKEIRLLKRLEPRYVGVGGLVPSLRGAIRKTFETIDLVQRELPESKIHLLGFAAPKAGLSYASKVHSLDYGGWRNATATGYVLTPNGYRKVSSRNKKGHASKPSKAELVIIRSVCRRLRISPSSLGKDFAARAIFSAYVATRILNGDKPLANGS